MTPFDSQHLWCQLNLTMTQTVKRQYRCIYLTCDYGLLCLFKHGFGQCGGSRAGQLVGWFSLLWSVKAQVSSVIRKPVFASKRRSRRKPPKTGYRSQVTSSQLRSVIRSGSMAGFRLGTQQRKPTALSYKAVFVPPEGTAESARRKLILDGTETDWRIER